MVASRLTVVIPLYNGAAFIADTLDSLTDQTVPLAEIIVVDDGSVDHGPAVVREHRARPTLLCQQHCGVAVARNRGVLAASSSHVAFLDQDDLWLPERHERLIGYLDANPTRALATTEQSFFLASDQSALQSMNEPMHETVENPAVEDLETLRREARRLDGPPVLLRRVGTRDLLQGTILVTTSFVIERELFFAAGGSPTFIRSADDYWTLLNVSRLTPIAHIDEPSVLYRIHPSSASMTTRWALPLLTSTAAARHGGNLVPLEQARETSVVGPITSFWEHQLLALARSGGRGLSDALAMVQLLAPSRRSQIALSTRLAKTAARSKLSALRNGA